MPRRRRRCVSARARRRRRRGQQRAHVTFHSRNERRNDGARALRLDRLFDRGTNERQAGGWRRVSDAARSPNRFPPARLRSRPIRARCSAAASARCAPKTGNATCHPTDRFNRGKARVETACGHRTVIVFRVQRTTAAVHVENSARRAGARPNRHWLRARLGGRESRDRFY